MRKLAITLTFVLMAVMASAQTVRTRTTISGLGEFRFGTARSEMDKALKNHSAENTKISDVAGYPLTASGIELAGYVFDNASFSFNDKGLQTIVLTAYFDDEDIASEEYSALLSVLERDYGRQSNRRARQSRLKNNYAWNDTQFNTITLSKEYDQKEKRTKISIYARGR